MKVAATTAVLAASIAYAQIPQIPSSASGLLSSLSQSCQTALFGLATNQQLTQCLNVPTLINVFSTNGSIIPSFDQYLAASCSSNPCSAATLNQTASQIISGCSSELSQYDISNSTIYQVIDAYPLAREIACLKTSMPAAANFTNASIPINSTAYNSTNGTFCVTSLMTELSAYVGQNLTISNLVSDVMNQNTSALSALESIPPTAICQDCIYAAVDLIYLQYPTVVTSNFTVMNTTFSVEEFLNNTCSVTDVPSQNATLPSTISATAYNSSFPYTFTANGTTHTGTKSTNSTSSPAQKRVFVGREASRL